MPNDQLSRVLDSDIAFTHERFIAARPDLHTPRRHEFIPARRNVPDDTWAGVGYAQRQVHLQGSDEIHDRGSGRLGHLRLYQHGLDPDA